jgi:hypothetical protein
VAVDAAERCGAQFVLKDNPSLDHSDEEGVVVVILVVIIVVVVVVVVILVTIHLINSSKFQTLFFNQKRQSATSPRLLLLSMSCGMRQLIHYTAFPYDSDLL